MTNPPPTPRPPEAGRLATTLRRVFAAQARDVARRLSVASVRAGVVPDTAAWVKVTADAVRPVVLALFQAGVLRSRRRLAARGAGPTGLSFVPERRRVLPTSEVMGKGVMWNETLWRMRRSSQYQRMSGPASPYVERAGGGQVIIPPPPAPVPPARIGLGTDLWNPRILDAVDEAVLRFCRETNETATVELAQAIRLLREALKRGLREGEAVALLAAKVRAIFADPARAFRIAATESSRAVHGGEFLNARTNSAVTGKEWLASADACPRCLEIMERGVIPLDEPFYVDPKGGPYAVVLYPPLHPHCWCTWTESVA